MVLIQIHCSQAITKLWHCASINSTDNIQESYRNGLSKSTLEFENCKQQLFMLIMCLPVCLWAQIARTPFNNMITAWMPFAKCDDYQFQGLILEFPASENHIVTISYQVCMLTPKKRYNTQCRNCEILLSSACINDTGLNTVSRKQLYYRPYL